MVGYKPDGKRDRCIIYGKTRGEVIAKLDAIRHHRQYGMPPPPLRLTVTKFMDQSLRDIIAPVRKPKTVMSYQQIVRLFLKPELGHHKLVDLHTK